MNYFQAILRIKVSKDFDIKNIAKLASINLSEEEQEKLDKDLSIILELSLIHISEPTRLLSIGGGGVGV